MKSRHTTIGTGISRSFGVDEEQNDLVVELYPSGHVGIREEPLHRKIGRGETLPEVRIDIREAWEAGSKRPSVEDAASLISELCARLPVASFGEGPPATVNYRAKVWLLNELKNITEQEHE